MTKVSSHHTLRMFSSFSYPDPLHRAVLTPDREPLPVLILRMRLFRDQASAGLFTAKAPRAVLALRMRLFQDPASEVFARSVSMYPASIFCLRNAVYLFIVS